MPRIARYNLETNYFHIITQGINKEYIFNNKCFKDKYIQLILNSLDKYEVKILAYCIMDNHAHILLYCDKIQEMSQYMKSVNTSYAKFYNKIKSRVGFVFRNRYETEAIDEAKHLLNCIGYIHNNPVKAGIVKTTGEYKFSSYNDYIKKEGIVNDQTIKMCFGTVNNYLEQYLIIHKSNVLFKDCEKIIEYKEFLNKVNKMDLVKLKADKDALQKLIKTAIFKEKIPINKLSEILEIDRFKIYRLLNK